MATGQVTEINPEWAGLIGKDSDRQGSSGGPYSIRTESGVYLMRDAGRLAAQQQGALAKVQLSATPAALNTWATDGWPVTGPESGFEIRGVELVGTDATNFSRAFVSLVDTLDSDTPVALLARADTFTLIKAGFNLYHITGATAREGILPARLPIFFRQQNTRWGVRLDVLSTAGGAMNQPILANVWYAQSLPGVDLDHG